MMIIIEILLLYFAIGWFLGYLALLKDADNDDILMIVIYWLPCILTVAINASFDFLKDFFTDFFADLFRLLRKKGGEK